jgi:integrase
MPSRVISFPAPATIGAGLNREEPTRGKERSRMARRKRQYGSGCLLEKGKGWVMRWREIEIAPDGTKKRVLRYETLGPMSRRQAAEILSQKVATASSGKAQTRSLVTFRTLASEWQAAVLPMYKHSTQKHRRFMLSKHLLPRFGDKALSEITRQEIQVYVAHLIQQGYAPKSIDHTIDVLSAVLRTAMKWGHLQENPARGVELPTLKTVRPKWALTPDQAARLLDKMSPLGRAMVGLAILSGLRRGELFALRWRDIDEDKRTLTVREAVYDGKFSTPKTEAGLRQIPLSDVALSFIGVWKRHAGSTAADALVFATKTGNSISPNNVLRRSIFPACTALNLPKATWLTFRRTYSSWSHDKGVPGKVVAQLMGHANVDTTLNVYTQVLDGSLRAAVDKIGSELFTIVQCPEDSQAPVG